MVRKTIIYKKRAYGGGYANPPWKPMLIVDKILDKNQCLHRIKRRGWGNNVFKALKHLGNGFEPHIDPFWVD